MSNSDMPAVRLARAGDAADLPAIETAAGALFASLPECEAGMAGEPISAARHRQLIAKRHCLVAVSDHRIVGFIACEPFRRELHIWEISVHPDYQQQGLGERLLRATMIDAHNAGFSALTLTTYRDVPWNAPFYGRLGFVEVEDTGSNARLDTLLKDEATGLASPEKRVAMIRFLG